jgi:hypothetical protein
MDLSCLACPRRLYGSCGGRLKSLRPTGPGNARIALLVARGETIAGSIPAGQRLLARNHDARLVWTKLGTVLLGNPGELLTKHYGR